MSKSICSIIINDLSWYFQLSCLILIIFLTVFFPYSLYSMFWFCPKPPATIFPMDGGIVFGFNEDGVNMIDFDHSTNCKYDEQNEWITSNDPDFISYFTTFIINPNHDEYQMPHTKTSNNLIIPAGFQEIPNFCHDSLVGSGNGKWLITFFRFKILNDSGEEIIADDYYPKFRLYLIQSEGDQILACRTNYLYPEGCPNNLGYIDITNQGDTCDENSPDNCLWYIKKDNNRGYAATWHCKQFPTTDEIRFRIEWQKSDLDKFRNEENYAVAVDFVSLFWMQPHIVGIVKDNSANVLKVYATYRDIFGRWIAGTRGDSACHAFAHSGGCGGYLPKKIALGLSYQIHLFKNLNADITNDTPDLILPSPYDWINSAGSGNTSKNKCECKFKPPFILDCDPENMDDYLINFNIDINQLNDLEFAEPFKIVMWIRSATTDIGFEEGFINPLGPVTSYDLFYRFYDCTCVIVESIENNIFHLSTNCHQ